MALYNCEPDHLFFATWFCQFGLLPSGNRKDRGPVPVSAQNCKILAAWANRLNKGGKLTIKIDPFRRYFGYKTVDNANAIEYGGIAGTVQCMREREFHGGRKPPDLCCRYRFCACQPQQCKAQRTASSDRIHLCGARRAGQGRAGDRGKARTGGVDPVVG